MSLTSNGDGLQEVRLSSFPSVVELNVGGVFYTTSISTLTKEPNSLLGQMFTGEGGKTAMRDSKGKFFIDRDGVIFRYILDYLRNQKVLLPENFHERERLKQEAEYFMLPGMVANIEALPSTSHSHRVPFSLAAASHISRPPGYITVGYRGTFAFGRDGLADVKFRKLTRILVCGKVGLCREVFGENLNESRDPDRCNMDRYTARFFLKHNFLEQAFDDLNGASFRCVAAAGSGTACGGTGEPLKPGMDSEENRWNHYNEFVFVRP
ncbi:BTB/POZ domain-containing protein KCTD12-like [Limulus polyphemus]|uniref:BTB/POZ domain-containing protein KCTD12-like n=1 Tax=Limulus polyphemus TaxID=6850 RepID=A0ABM1SNE5_LIMPO|nr:BTB/POZ domain-containing protein KCTD12-like [Limulus polyphemus]